MNVNELTLDQISNYELQFIQEAMNLVHIYFLNSGRAIRRSFKFKKWKLKYDDRSFIFMGTTRSITILSNYTPLSDGRFLLDVRFPEFISYHQNNMLFWLVCEAFEIETIEEFDKLLAVIKLESTKLI